MRIGIDASFISFPGVGRYISCLIKGFQSLNLDDQFFMYGLGQDRLQLEQLVNHNIFLKELNFKPLSIFSQIEWNRILIRDDIEIFHAAHYVHPLWLPKKIKLVITLHDAVYLDFLLPE